MSGHVLGVAGTFSWSGGGVKNLVPLGEESGYELLEDCVVEAKCAPKKDDLDKLRQLAKAMAEKLRGE